MKLKDKDVQMIAGGLILGILLTLGVQWGMKTYQVTQAKQKLTAYSQAYDQAKDKKAFMDQYFSMKTGASISLSKSNAAVQGETGSTDMEICQNMFDFLVQAGFAEPGMTRDGGVSQGMGPNYPDVYDTFWRMQELRCIEVLAGTYKGRGPGEINN